MSKGIMVVNPKDFGIEENRAKSIQAAFVPMLDKMVKLEDEYNQIIKLDIDEETCKQAKDLRKKYVKVRTGTAAIHKEQKAFYLSAGRFIDSWKTTQLSTSQGIEEKLSNIENHFENIKKAEIARLQIERAGEFAKYGGVVIPGNLGEMMEDIWNNFIAGTKLNHETQQAAEKKAESDRIERIHKEELEKTRRYQCSKLINFIPDFETTLFANLTDVEYSNLVDTAVIARDKESLRQKAVEEENARLKKEADDNQKKLDAQKKLDDAEKAKIKAKADAEIAKEKKEKEALIKAEEARKEELVRKAIEKDEENERLALAPDNDKLILIRTDLLEHINTIDLISLESEKTNGLKANLLMRLYDSIEELTDYVESL